jgi:hypothetical protein
VLESQKRRADLDAHILPRRDINRCKLTGLIADQITFRWRRAFSAAIYAFRFNKDSAADLRSRKPVRCSNEQRAVGLNRVGPELRLLRDANGAALIEFAVALPLLIVLVVGIFDFGGAFNLKQELSNAVREGAIFGASQPTNDLLNPGNAPPSVDAVRYLVASYLQTAGISDCGLATMPPPGSGGGQIWVYTTPPGSCPGLLQLTIKRPCIGSFCPPTVGTYTANTYIPNTYVKISYPYQWHFNNVIQLLVPGASYALSTITADAAAANLN